MINLYSTIEEEELPAMLNKHLDLEYTFKGNQIIVTSPIDNAKKDEMEEESVEDLTVLAPNISIKEKQLLIPAPKFPPKQQRHQNSKAVPGRFNPSKRNLENQRP